MLERLEPTELEVMEPEPTEPEPTEVFHLGEATGEPVDDQKEQV